MNILFIQDHVEALGGTQTLTARLAKMFLDDGASVTVILTTNRASSSVLRVFPEDCQFVFLDSKLRRLVRFPFGLRNHLPKFKKPYDAVISFSLGGFYLAEILGVYYGLKGPQYWYVVSPESIKHDPLKTAKLFILSGGNEKNIIFMNQECKVQFKENQYLNIDESPIIPLPVNSRNKVTVSISPPRIISIGRIEPRMKTYNWSMLNVVRELRKKHPELTWEIYGDGSEENIANLKQSIQTNECQDFVFLRGRVEYEKMEDALYGKSVFVGMGTAAVEAASAGLPTVVAIGFASDPVTYGYLHDLPFGNVGEENDNLKKKSISEMLDELFSYSQSEYDKVSEKSLTVAKKYSAEASYSSILDLVNSGGCETKRGFWFKITCFYLYLTTRIHRVIFNKLKLTSLN